MAWVHSLSSNWLGLIVVLGLASCGGSGLPAPVSTNAAPPDAAPRPLSVSDEDIGLRSDACVAFAWAVDIGEASLANAEFEVFWPIGWMLRTRDGRYVHLYPRWVNSGREQADGVEWLRIGPTRESVGGLEWNGTLSPDPALTPHIDGYRYVGGGSLSMRARAPSRVGLWRSENGGETLIVAFDETTPQQPDRPPHRVVARMAFDATVIATNGSHHGGPTTMMLAGDPDERGTFRLVVLRWPPCVVSPAASPTRQSLNWPRVTSHRTPSAASTGSG